MRIETKLHQEKNLHQDILWFLKKTQKMTRLLNLDKSERVPPHSAIENISALGNVPYDDLQEYFVDR